MYCDINHITLPKDKFPEGLKIQEKEGIDILPPLLEKLKKYSFRGYLKILYGKFGVGEV